MPKRRCDKLKLMVKFRAQMLEETENLCENFFSRKELEIKNSKKLRNLGSTVLE